MNVCGEARPLISACQLQAKKCGVRAYGSCRPQLDQCILQDCGEQGLKAMDRAHPLLTLCALSPADSA